MTDSDTLPRVAYFCMEYGLSEKFPIYAGGLGILAGDVLKSAHDLDLPVVGVGILWRHGYTTQRIDAKGHPYDVASEFETDFLEDTGVTIDLTIRGGHAPCKVWVTRAFGNAPLYLLDADVPGSDYWWVTKCLYCGVEQDRIASEIVLGIGGVRALRALGVDVDVYHFNEGHAALAGVELIREQIELGKSFEEALASVSRRIVFTTHTPVKAGNEEHDHGLLEYMGAYDGLDYARMARIGGDPFGMTVAGLRLAHLSNGVSTLHGLTARSMWEDVPEASPITDITNGVHTKTWQDRRMRQAYASGLNVWETHIACKQELFAEIDRRNGVRLHPEVLTIGFARRAAPYKRSDLIFRRPEVIEPLLQTGQIQLIFSGKSHPEDIAGQSIVARLVQMSHRFPENVVFLADYDMELGKLLTRGCDVWLNNPKRPLEASGTSGMKAAMNGVLNLSTLDGWWPEGAHHGVTGWIVGGGFEGDDQQQRDLVSLYDVLLGEVLPTYYGRREKWVDMMKASIAMSHYRFSSDRMLLEYYNLLYQPYVPRETATDVPYRPALAGQNTRPATVPS